MFLNKSSCLLFAFCFRLRKLYTDIKIVYIGQYISYLLPMLKSDQLAIIILSVFRKDRPR